MVLPLGALRATRRLATLVPELPSGTLVFTTPTRGGASSSMIVKTTPAAGRLAPLAPLTPKRTPDCSSFSSSASWVVGIEIVFAAVSFGAQLTVVGGIAVKSAAVAVAGMVP